MQIRLTVLGPRTEPGPGRAGGSDVLVTAPPGTALAAVAAALTTAAGADQSAALYAGTRRLDPQRCLLGDPPLTDGGVLRVGAPVETGPGPGDARDATAQLHVVSGPDAGGVHLLHGGQIRVGRSAEADVPLDDPDVSRLHCAVTVTPEHEVYVTDLGSTNGTSVDGRDVHDRPLALTPGALLRLGESTLRLTAPDGLPSPLPLAPDGEGHVRVPVPGETAADSGATGPGTPGGFGGPGGSSGAGGPGGAGGAHDPYAHEPRVPAARTPREDPPRSPGAGHGSRQGPAPGAADWPGDGTISSGDTHAGRSPLASRPPAGPGAPPTPRPVAPSDEPARSPRRRGGLGSWARRLAVGRPDQSGPPPERDTDPTGALPGPDIQSWPDAATLLLTALGPGPRLWERGPGHPQLLSLRLGTTGRTPAPAAVDLLAAGSLGIAGPRDRLLGAARFAAAQLAALHAPDLLEIVLVSADPARTPGERTGDWGWLGWLPHVRPAQGQNCRLLLAYDHDQATARLDELGRRLDDRATGPAPGGAAPPPPGGDFGAGPQERALRTVLIVDGDPGGAALRERLAHLAAEGAPAGIHVLLLADAAPASPHGPLAVPAALRDCGAVALLSGDVATTLRLAPDPQGLGNAAVDAVSHAWAERFARALAPLRTVGAPRAHPRMSAPLPPTTRLLDELGLARATPASLMARWAATADSSPAPHGRACAVLGAGIRGPVTVDLAADGPHLLVEGPPGSGRTELLRSLAASLAAAERPDRLTLLLVDGLNTAPGSRATRPDAGGTGLGVCTDLPHVSSWLTATDPVRMRDAAQALIAGLKQRDELLRTVGQGASMPRLVVVVDDVDALLAPALGAPGRPAAGSVIRALEAVARDGARLRAHLVLAGTADGPLAASALGRAAALRVRLTGQTPEEGALPGRGVLRTADGADIAFQGGRVTGRIPRTAAIRPTVAPLEWERMGDAPVRRSVRELGNGPTDLALLASAIERAARQITAEAVPSTPQKSS